MAKFIENTCKHCLKSPEGENLQNKPLFFSILGMLLCLSCGEQPTLMSAGTSERDIPQAYYTETLSNEESSFDIQVEKNSSVLEKKKQSNLDTENRILEALAKEEEISIAIGIFTFAQENSQDSLALTRVPWKHASSQPKTTYVNSYFSRFNKPKPPEYPGTFKAIKKPVKVLTAIQGLKFVPKSGIDNEGISATFKFLHDNTPKQNRRAKWASKLIEKHPGMFRRFAEQANEQNSQIGAFIAKVEQQQYAKIRGNLTEMENRLGRTVFGKETWDSFDPSQFTNCTCMTELVIESENIYKLASSNVQYLGSTAMTISKKSYASISDQIDMYLQAWGFSNRQSTPNTQNSANTSVSSAKTKFKVPYPSFIAYRIFRHSSMGK